MHNLELGAGNTRRSGFFTVDLSLSADFPYDLRAGLPFQKNSIDFIYGEHVLEHFSIQDLLNLLKECYRVLKPGGRLSVVVPDASIYINAYSKNDLFDKENYCLFEFGLPYKTKIDYLNYIFYMGGHHRYMFDTENMLAILTLCGFKNVCKRDFDDQLDQAVRKHESIYFVASK